VNRDAGPAVDAGRLVIALGALALLASLFLDWMPPALLWFAGPFALLVVLVAIINPPPLVSGIDPTLEAGIWVALGGALVMTIGVAVSMLRVSVVVGGRERSRAGAEPRAEMRTMPTEPGDTEPPPRDPRVPPPRQ
jgi:hypothetical protein